ncbi:hypothetical protein KC345_g93 [Hortaea werneckii]|nr:hypothetical protein KC345_g93 [Hortaea werneckii]
MTQQRLTRYSSHRRPEARIMGLSRSWSWCIKFPDICIYGAIRVRFGSHSFYCRIGTTRNDLAVLGPDNRADALLVGIECPYALSRKRPSCRLGTRLSTLPSLYLAVRQANSKVGSASSTMSSNAAADPALNRRTFLSSDPTATVSPDAAIHCHQRRS